MFRQILYPISVMLAFFLMLFVYTKLLGPIPFSVESVTTNKSEAFSVRGEGKALVKPDSATVHVGVSAEGQDAKVVQDKMNQNINKVIEAVKALGIDEKDIKTASYNIYEAFDNVAPRPLDDSIKLTVKKYQGNTSVVVKVKDMGLANQVLDTAIAAGATNAGGVTFDVLDKARAETEAREMAVKEAKTKAQTAAKAVGFRLGKIINYSEGSEPLDTFLYNKTEVAQDARGGANPSNVQPGENEVFVTVTLSYEIY